MEELLLTFSKKQYEEYLKIKEASSVELDFKTGKPTIEVSSQEMVKAELNKMKSECEKLLVIKNRQNVFSSDLSRKEIENLIPIFYTVIGKIDQSKRSLYQESIKIVGNLEKADKIRNEIYSRYADFLPYRAALGNIEEYRERITDIDKEFKESISFAESQIKHEKELLSKISNIADVIVPDFFKDISRAADAPKFLNFDKKAFFFAVSAFVEKTNSI